MDYMFARASSFNQNLNNFNTGAVVAMTGMFMGSSAFNQNINGWNTANVVRNSQMFYGYRYPSNGHMTEAKKPPVCTNGNC